jgi:hypothetical protein
MGVEVLPILVWFILVDPLKLQALFMCLEAILDLPVFYFLSPLFLLLPLVVILGQSLQQQFIMIDLREPFVELTHFFKCI